MGVLSQLANMWSRVAVLVTLTASCHAGLLGAGYGEGSCAAAPFRTNPLDIKWKAGCPATAPCCSEYGYCRGAEEWNAGGFRDCNGISNGLALKPEVLEAEAVAAAHGDLRGQALLVAQAGVSVGAAAGYAVAAAPPLAVATAPAVAVAAAPAGLAAGLFGHGIAAGYGYNGLAGYTGAGYSTGYALPGYTGYAVAK